MKPSRGARLIVCSALLLGFSWELRGATASETSATSKPVDLTEIPLEQLMEIEVPKVYGASKLEQKASEAPSSVTIVTSDEIKKLGYRTLAEVLQGVVGFNVSYDRNYSFVGARGLSLGDFNSRILLLLDGHRLNNNLTDAALVDTSFILDIDLVDRVEIIRGPGSVLYGNNALFAVINVITRKGGQVNGAEMSGEYASFDSWKGRFTVGKQFTNGLEFLLSGTLFYSDGAPKLFYKEFNTPSQNNGVAENLDSDAFQNFFGSVSYKDFTLEGAWISREKENPTAQYQTTFNDPRLTTEDGRGYASLRYAHSFADVVDVTAQVYYDRNTFEITYPQSVVIGTNVIFSSVTTERDVGEWWGADVQFSKHIGRHVLSLGGEYRDDFRLEQRLTGQPEVERDRQNYGVYVQGDFFIRTNLHLIGGVRYDQYGDYDPAFSPRVAVIYNPIKTATIKAIYGTAFRAPNFSESDPRFAIEPEHIHTYELVYEQELGRHLRSSIVGFYNQLDDLVVFQSGNFTNFDAQTAGVELALEGFWANGVRGRVSYSYQDTRNESVAWEMPDSPNNTVKFNLIVPLYKDKIFAGAEFLYTSTRRSLHNTTDSSGQPVTVQGETVSGYGIVNLTLFSQNLVKNLEFSGGVYNLFDATYSDPASRFHVQDTLERDGRTFRIKLTYRF